MLIQIPLCQFLMVLTRNYHLTKSQLITGQSDNGCPRKEK
nr:MAG TPA: hypothetical protein [Caudoviricetes sp.]